MQPRQPDRPLLWPPVVDTIQQLCASYAEDVYLVGGAVRDAYLHHAIKDLDLATPGDGRPLARRIANAFDGAYYPLDAQRGVGRAIINWQDRPFQVDVAQFRGDSLQVDLEKRDFTINALAVALCGDRQQVFDPTNGLADLQAKRVRQCQPDSLRQDPVRVLRAVRVGLGLGFMIEPATQDAVRENAPGLQHVAAERVRDEFMQLLGGAQPSAALDVLRRLDILGMVVPEALKLMNVEQSPPHRYGVWRHTLLTVQNLDMITRLFIHPRDDNLTANAQLGLLAWTLNGIRDRLEAHLAQLWPEQRSYCGLLALAALLHDAGKPDSLSIDEAGVIHFVNHDVRGAEIAETRATALRLSGDEVDRLAVIVRHHMRPLWLANAERVSSRAIYRFWRDAGPAGVDICLLSAADFLATFGSEINQDDWIHHLEVLHMLLDSYFSRHDQVIAPPALLTGRDLLQRFGLTPGPAIGEMLEAVREAQIEGEITTHEEALAWVERYLRTSRNN